MSEPIISVSGLRGIIGESLTPDLAMRYAVAFATGLPAGPIVISRDGRTTGRMLADCIRSALCAVGRDVIDVDVAATPTTGVLVRSQQAVGGIQISASHNPPEYNGMKLFNAEGRVIPSDAGEKVLQRYRADGTVWVPYEKVGEVRACDDPFVDHLGLVLATIDVERVRRSHFHVLLDSNHGAGGLLGKRLLEQLGCKITLLGGEPTGRFAHTPEPTAENLAGVCEKVVTAKAHVGFCQDPDADRLAVIDERGSYIGEEYTVALCLDHVLRKSPGPVVTNCSTSRMSEDLAKKYGCPFFRSPVGEANVVEVMKTQKAVFGGEGNGGPIDPRVGFVRDSFVGMALILDALAARQMKLSHMAHELPRYEIHKSKVTLPREKIPAAFEALAKHFTDAKLDRMDGLRLDWPGKWLLVRASNTEPVVRAISEASTAEEAQILCETANRIMATVK